MVEEKRVSGGDLKSKERLVDSGTDQGREKGTEEEEGEG